LRTTFFSLILAFTFAVSGVGAAEQTLTITLDPTQEEAKKQAQSDLELKHETLGATKTGSEAKYKAQVASKPSAKKEVTIGQVGVITASKASIKSAPSRRGHTLFTCPKGTYLAIVGQNGAWYGVLMIDSSTGWIEKSKVNLLNYQVMGQQSQPNGQGGRIVNTALKYLGIRYTWGGYSFNGLDCSGFVKAVFASHGISLPRVAREQALVGTPVGWSQLLPGDRLYFACKGSQIDHAGVYMGNGLFIHSSASNGGVAVDNILKPFYANSLVSARRS